MAARAASVSRRWSAAGSAAMESSTGRSDAVRGAGGAKRSENCDCPPGRCRKSTSQRATVRATSGPWSSSTSASARSIPAVTPAEVATLPSRTKIRSGSTVTSGCARPGRSTTPSASSRGGRRAGPAVASSSAPVQTDVTLRARPASRAMCRTTAASSTAACTPKPPATSSVSSGPRADFERHVGLQPQAAARTHLPRAGRGQLDVVAAAGQLRGAVEDLRRPGSVEHLEALERDDEHPSHARHALTPSGVSTRTLTPRIPPRRRRGDWCVTRTARPRRRAHAPRRSHPEANRWESPGAATTSNRACTSPSGIATLSVAVGVAAPPGRW